MVPRITSDLLHKYLLKGLLPVILHDRYIVNGTWNEEKCICISFDCDTDDDMIRVPSLLRTLKDMGISCSFALVGRIAIDYPHVVEEIARKGCEIVNHTFSHPERFGSLNSENIAREVESFQDVMMSKFRYRPQGFRAPHLLRRYNSALFRIVRENKLYDSSYVGRGVSKIDSLLELPLTPCPEHSQICFDYWHHYQLPLIRSSSRKFLDLWEKLLSKERLVNVYLDPYLVSDVFLKEMIRRVPNSFSFLRLQDISNVPYKSTEVEKRCI